MKDIRAGISGNHASGHSPAQKSLKQEYYWPNMRNDAMNFTRKCKYYQKFVSIPRQPVQEVVTNNGPCPFTIWDIDFAGPMHKGKFNMRFTIMVVDYFTKWVEVEPLVNITKANACNSHGITLFVGSVY